MNSEERWQHYIPSLAALGIAFTVLVFPILAVLLVVGGLMTFAALFSYVVFRIHKAQDRSRAPDAEIFDAEFKDFNEPNFRNVTVYMVRKGRWFQDINDL